MNCTKFTAETAVIAARKSVEAKRAAKLNPPAVAVPFPDAVFAPLPADDYTIRRLRRVRKQLDMVDRMIDDCTDPKSLFDLQRTQTGLSEQERKLSGRPDPGSLRPTKASSRRAPGGPVVPE